MLRCNNCKMSAEEYYWNFDYARLARDSGFSFQIQKSKPSVDKNISLLDIDQIIRERDTATIEKFIDVVIAYSLDNDQTSVLDPNFVKIFYLCQLSVQYLLFCKKYLDNTIVLVKADFKKNNEEVNNLKCCIGELQEELANSKKQVKALKSALNCPSVHEQSQSVYQCNECSKAFLTEEYLLGHVKRRHNALMIPDSSATLFQTETDKLQLEIKELKERLNNTEKYVHIYEANKSLKEPAASEKDPPKTLITENIVLTELQQKFEDLKRHVQNELQILQTQKFDQEKYENWFGRFLDKIEQSHTKLAEFISQEKPIAPVIKLDESSHSIQVGQKQDSLKSVEIVKTDSITQTDGSLVIHAPKCETCQNKQEKQIKKPHMLSSYNDVYSYIPEHQTKIDNDTKFGVLEETVNIKITGSLEKLENQMISLWNKMNEIHVQKLQAVNPVSNEDIKQTSPSIKMPVVKPRQRLNNLHNKSLIISSKEPPKLSSQNKSTTNNVHLLSDHDETENSNKELQYKKYPSVENVCAQSYIKSGSTEEDSNSETVDQKGNKRYSTAISKSSRTLNQGSTTSFKQTLTSDVLDGFHKEIENELNNHLKQIGVSPEWTVVPSKSYDQAIQKIEYQSNLLNKDIPNYEYIRNQIVRDVDNQVAEKRKSKKLICLRNNIATKGKDITQKHPKTSFSVEQLSSKKSPSIEKQQKRPSRMYITDSESESSKILEILKPPGETEATYSNFTKELNATVRLRMKEQDNVTDVANPPVTKEDGTNKSDVQAQAKGVLKNYPSVGSLHKKKVLFDLESSNIEQKSVKQEVTKTDCGSTSSSIASLVFDGTMTNEKKSNSKENELTDVSDWELSDILK